MKLKNIKRYFNIVQILKKWERLFLKNLKGYKIAYNSNLMGI